MTSNGENHEKEITEEELESIDEALSQIETLYISRCVSMPGSATNVVVREIPSKDDKKE